MQCAAVTTVSRFDAALHTHVVCGNTLLVASSYFGQCRAYGIYEPQGTNEHNSRTFKSVARPFSSSVKEISAKLLSASKNARAASSYSTIRELQAICCDQTSVRASM